MLNGFINLYNQAKGVLKELFKKQSSEGFVCNRKKFYWSLTFPSLSLDIECFDLAGAKIRQTRLVPFDSVSFRNLIMQIKLARRMQSSLPSGINKVLKYDNSSERHSHTVAVSCNIGSEDQIRELGLLLSRGPHTMPAVICIGL